eukprot:IDg8473t1
MLSPHPTVRVLSAWAVCSGRCGAARWRGSVPVWLGAATARAWRDWKYPEISHCANQGAFCKLRAVSHIALLLRYRSF